MFCGSSNFSEGGEKSNGDNLIAVQYQAIAVCYAVEAIHIYDHYRFRSQHEASTSENPLKLASDDKWTARYYNSKDIKYKERRLFCHD